MPSGLQEAAQSLQVIRQLFRRTDCAPLQHMAVRGLTLGLESLQPFLPTVRELHAAVAVQVDELALQGPKGLDQEPIQPFDVSTRVYDCFIHLAHAKKRDWQPDAQVAALLTAKAIEGVLIGKWPSDQFLAKVGRCFSAPDQKSSTQWTPKDRATALKKAVRRLASAISEKKEFAASLGLAAARQESSRPHLTGIARFNKQLQGGRAARHRYSKKKDRGGGGGQGALTVAEIGRTGYALLNGIEQGTSRAVYGYLECTTDLSDGLAMDLPVQLGETPPPAALAWIDGPRGHFCSMLEKVVRKGAKPHKGSEHLYVQTSQVLRRPLSPPVASAIREEAASKGASGWCHLKELLGECAVKPDESICPELVQGATVRRVQRSLSVQLIDLGFHRWPIALVVQNGLIVSGAREFYGAVGVHLLDEVNTAMHKLLGFPAPDPIDSVEPIGSRVTPSDQAVKSVLDTFAKAAQRANKKDSVSEVAARVNRFGEWLLAMMALCLALRGWRIYAISPRRLCTEAEILFCEKEVHEQEAPTPVPLALKRAAEIWVAAVKRSVADLEAIGGEKAQLLAGLLRNELERTDGLDTVFWVRADFQLRPAGTANWTRRLGASLRVVENFGRHFWPMHLMNSGLPQLVIDVLMRHQVAGLNSQTEARGGTRIADTSRLVQLMNHHIERLALTWPDHLTGAIA